MNKSEKEHLCERVTNIVNLKLARPKHKRPDFDEFVVGRAKRGAELNLLPARMITAVLATFDPTEWRSRKTLNLSEVIAKPAEFLKAQRMADMDLEFCERKNASILKRLRELKDRIELGQVKDGVKTIAEVEAWTL